MFASFRLSLNQFVDTMLDVGMFIVGALRDLSESRAGPICCTMFVLDPCLRKEQLPSRVATFLTVGNTENQDFSLGSLRFR